ncbi:hypothetical protein NNO04_13350 [Citrobacter sp. Awk 4]|uniref:hypothetical protein n=1 Tax=Citrobacter sp. Awk 4 TaxID=2963955 RepID=UPI0023028E05|nr:hypothetical protein [Citrobacter sp. Awk 4]MDA8479686.1 hypothetical protein [Citrobacter sp. Awk 4]
MKNTALLLSLLMTGPALADVSINSNGVRVSMDREDEINEWKNKHKNECSSVTIGGVKVTSDGCSSKDKENRSVHGDNNPGKGHDKNKNKNDGDDDYTLKVEHYDSDSVKSKGKGKQNK